MDAPPVALVSLLTTDRRLIYRPVQHLTSCQSGVWRSGDSNSGKYTYLGGFWGVYSASNPGTSTLWVFAQGGNSAGSGSCRNVSRLEGYVDSALISVNADNSPSFGKSAFISFAVPPGSSFRITSYPTENVSCGSGVFSVYGYQ